MSEKQATTVDLPKNLDAERWVLGAALLDKQALYAAAEILKPEDFSLAANRRIFAAMLELEQEGTEPELLALTERLERDGGLESVGGAAYVSGLTDGMPARSNVEHYARLVKETAYLRQIALTSEALMTVAVERGATAEEVLARWESSLGVIREEQLSTSQVAMPIRDAVREALPILERVGQGAGVILGTPTGFTDLDHRIAGWVPGDFVVLAARPSAGKTALCLEFLRRQAEMGTASVIFSLEMSRASVVLRLACREARVDSHRFREGWLNSEEWSRLSGALGRIAELPIWVDDRPVLEAHQVRWRLRSLAKRHGIKLAVVDYLQLLRAKGENRTQQVTEISLQLKAAARELGEISGGTLIAVSQLTRIPKNEKPELHHLRESGQIEQDADTVLFISDAEEARLGQADPWPKLVEIAKQRNGPTGSIQLVFLPKIMGFEPLARAGGGEQ